MPQAVPDDKIERGVRRLLEGPLLLKKCGAAVWKDNPGVKGSAQHRGLFLEYREEVDLVTAIAFKWWNETILARSLASESNEDVVRDAWVDRPAGPASFPGLVALIREYWLACDRLNGEVAEAERVTPWTFLLGWLLDGNYKQTVSVLACMPYWPVGMDKEGSWV